MGFRGRVGVQVGEVLKGSAILGLYNVSAGRGLVINAHTSILQTKQLRFRETRVLLESPSRLQLAI